MNIKNFSVKEVSGILQLLLNKNFLEWRRMKAEIFFKSHLKEPDWNEKEIEEILTSEPIAFFYAHWLKLAQTKDGDKKKSEKIFSYLKGRFAQEQKSEKDLVDLFVKCELIANIDHTITPKIIDSALSIQTLMEKDGLSLKEIFDNEKTYRVIIKSTTNSTEWKMNIGAPFKWLCQHKIPKNKRYKVRRAINEVLAKREKELFS
ncbi:MAG: hypothetical protein M1155_00900 [Patescibacteria group bacterium]|nr:hypothetical protein [Patescibacteria group bacterium]